MIQSKLHSFDNKETFINKTTREIMEFCAEF